jgi:hypothetical protein
MPLLSVAATPESAIPAGAATPSRAAPWIPSSASPSLKQARPTVGSPFGQLSKQDARRKGIVAGLVKVKVAQLTALLGRQLDLVERLEDRTMQVDGEEVVAELTTLAAQETQLLHNFHDRIRATLR